MRTVGGLDNQVIATLYCAVDDDDRWVDLLDILRHSLRVESAAVQYLDSSGDSPVVVWGSRDSLSQSRAALHDSWVNSPANPRFHRSVRKSVNGQIGSDHRTFDYSAEDRRKLHDGLNRCGMGPAFWISEQIDCLRRFTLIFHRPPHEGLDVTMPEQAMLEALMPHFRQATGLWLKLHRADARANLMEQAFAGISTAIIACDRRLQIHWMNARACQLLEAGEVLRWHNDKLSCAARDDQEQLTTLVKGREGETVVALGRGTQSCLHVRVRPLEAVFGQISGPRDVVFLSISQLGETIRYDVGAIATLFGLTMTEAALASSLSDGASVQDFALQRGIAEGTARQHLKHILAKTGTSRQSELVRRICLSVAGMKAGPFL